MNRGIPGANGRKEETRPGTWHMPYKEARIQNQTAFTKNEDH
jgi:hypothetical protein